MNNNELMHFGIPGMKWGRRKARPITGGYNSRRGNGQRPTSNTPNQSNEQRKARRKRAIKIGASVAGAALAAYGTYKVSSYLKSESGKKKIQAGKNFISRKSNKANRNGLYVNRASVNRTTTNRATVNRNAEMNRAMRDYMERANRVMNTFGPDGTDWRRRR